MDFATEVKRRRTFAIISHPDAGKTTITEKILWHGGAINVAGEVKGKAGTKAATSDWMKMEQQRGISITSSVMQFDYQGLRVNLLDTPGHKDFGEDTYRTLVAADCAAMLIDAANGVESQTRKLYEVCRLRKMPIFTFANKMDREGKSPLDLIDDVETTLQMQCYPVTWPIGMGNRFAGLYHRLQKKIYLYDRTTQNTKIVDIPALSHSRMASFIDSEVLSEFLEEIELLEGTLPAWSDSDFTAGKITPMTFGSAKYNWGIDLFLELFARWAPPPQPRISNQGVISPSAPDFSAFVFKIQANMDKKHRDRMAFIRVCSGKFERGMKATHVRLKREIRLAYSSQLMAQDRETVDVAFPGDIVGINDKGNFQIGDTLSNGQLFEFGDIPRFSPEHFGRLVVRDALKRKQLDKGIKELVDEGTIQLFYRPNLGKQDPILAVVGLLQFEVLLFRLLDEYGVTATLDTLPFKLARWPVTKNLQPVTHLEGGIEQYLDAHDQPVILLKGDWELGFIQEKNPEVQFLFTSKG